MPNTPFQSHHRTAFSSVTYSAVIRVCVKTEVWLIHPQVSHKWKAWEQAVSIWSPAILILKTTWKGHTTGSEGSFSSFLAGEPWWPGSELELLSSEKRTFGHTSHDHSNQDKWNLQKCFPKSMDEIQEKCWELAGSQMEGAKKGKESKDSHGACCSAFLLLAWECSLVMSSVQ